MLLIETALKKVPNQARNQNLDTKQSPIYISWYGTDGGHGGDGGAMKALFRNVTALEIGRAHV